MVVGLDTYWGEEKETTDRFGKLKKGRNYERIQKGGDEYNMSTILPDFSCILPFYFFIMVKFSNILGLFLSGETRNQIIILNRFYHLKNNVCLPQCTVDLTIVPI